MHQLTILPPSRVLNGKCHGRVGHLYGRLRVVISSTVGIATVRRKKSPEKGLLCRRAGVASGTAGYLCCGPSAGTGRRLTADGGAVHRNMDLVINSEQIALRIVICIPKARVCS